MKRNTNVLFLESQGSTIALPWVNSQPVFDGYQEPTRSILETAWDDFLDSGEELEVIADPEIVPPVVLPDWDGLTNHILGGDLFAIYTRLTTACFVAPDATLTQISNANNIAVASGKLDQAVAVTKVEGAVFASFQLLVTTSDYRFTAEEKTLWDATVDSLNFSPLVHLP